jgi:hypothetical protein
MQHVHGVADGCNVEDPMGFVRIAYSYFPAARTDRRHRLPIGWVIALLHDVKLLADTLTCAMREVAQIVDGSSDEHDVLHSPSIQKSI